MFPHKVTLSDAAHNSQDSSSSNAVPHRNLPAPRVRATSTREASPVGAGPARPASTLHPVRPGFRRMAPANHHVLVPINERIVFSSAYKKFNPALCGSAPAVIFLPSRFRLTHLELRVDPSVIEL